MALLEAELTTAILADGGISALIDTRLYPAILPQNPTYPALTYFLVSNGRQATYTGAGLKHPRYQFDAFAETYGAAAELIDAVKQFMPTTSATWGSTLVSCATQEDERDLPWEDDPEIYRRMIDYKLWVMSD